MHVKLLHNTPLQPKGDPFSIAHNVALLIPARSATISADIFLLNLAYFIYNPICYSMFNVSGNNTIDFLGITSSPYVNNIMHKWQFLFNLFLFII